MAIGPALFRLRSDNFVVLDPFASRHEIVVLEQRSAAPDFHRLTFRVLKTVVVREYLSSGIVDYVPVHLSHCRGVSIDRAFRTFSSTSQRDFGRKRKDNFGVLLSKPGPIRMFLAIRPANADRVICRYEG